MYAQAVLPQDFNPFFPSAVQQNRERSVRTPVPPKAVLRWVQVVSWLAAPVGLAAFLAAQ